MSINLHSKVYPENFLHPYRFQELKKLYSGFNYNTFETVKNQTYRTRVGRVSDELIILYTYFTLEIRCNKYSRDKDLWQNLTVYIFSDN